MSIPGDAPIERDITYAGKGTVDQVHHSISHVPSFPWNTVHEQPQGVLQAP